VCVCVCVDMDIGYIFLQMMLTPNRFRKSRNVTDIVN
jgi:hypothetical protein